jgi:predicted O-linked N-acetylglucosamine transferase (SPINDLY family)
MQELLMMPRIQSVDDACSNAMQLQLAGRLELAEQLYREILQAEPQHAAANYGVGMLNVQLLRPSDGVSFLLAALQADPQIPDYWLGYLEALLLSGRADEAGAALALGRQHGLAGDAVEDFAKRLERASGGEEECALLATLQQGDTGAALVSARRITQRFPERGLSWKVLGALLWAEGCAPEALAAMQNSVRLMPQDAEAHSNLGLTFAKLNRFDEAEAYLRKAIDIDPQFATAHYRLGMTYSLQARLPEAEASLRKGISLRADYTAGDDAQNHSNLLFILSHNPAVDADSLFAEHCRFGEHFEDCASWPQHLNDRDPDRCLKVGFVSGDLREHAVATFIEPLLAQLRNHRGLQLHAYYNNPVEDEVSRRLRASFESWHAISTLSDTQLAERIMHDRIDILIDLSGHTALNRLPVFALKPAPIQASWIGYPGTTGLRAMDYYLGARGFLPPAEFDRYFTEKLIELPANGPFQHYESAPTVNALPALASRCLTFGSFNRPDKINDATIGLWSSLLRELPGAKMILGGIPLESQRDTLIEKFATCGIAQGRLIFHPPYDMDTYLALYHQVDICMDTSPYNGGTTTIHALWMGVPTLTVAGTTPAARSGAAILGQVGLHEFVTKSAAEFVEAGLYWAQNLAALAQLRAGLRERWQGSPDRGADVIATALDAALRRMWKRWCAKLPAESFVPAVEPQPAAPQAAGGPEPAQSAKATRPIKTRKPKQGHRRTENLSVRKQENALLAMVQQRDFHAASTLALSMTQRFPDRGLGWKILGAVLPTRDSYDNAIVALQTAARLMPRDAEAHINLGLTLAKAKRFSEAEFHLHKALEIKPGFAAAHFRLAVAYELQGRFADAEASLRRGIAVRTDYIVGDNELSYSHLLFLMSHNPLINADELFAEHCRYGEYFEDRLRKSWPKHPNSRDPEKCLKVGFVSGDLCLHAVASFVEPIFAQLKSDPGLELHAYYTHTRQDDVSQRLLGNFKSWNVVCTLTDVELAGVIMKDRVDILIDLSGHTGLNRLPAFARKPAPVQASWIGYPGTTGLHAMDYYLTDHHFLPAARFARHFTERLAYLPANAPFQPHPSAVAVNDLPALATGHLTFGSFNRLGKINAATVTLWSQLLRAVPEATMLIAGIALDVEHSKLVDWFAAEGVGRERLTFHPRCGMDSYLAQHHDVDICLDTYPYNGGTTTMHALWMGVPTLTLDGPTPPARQGVAIMGRVGLDRFIAASAADFIDKGCYWANHLTELAEVRAGLRERWRLSPLRDPEVVARGLQRALRHMWRRWCAGMPAESFEISDSVAEA